jgi:hypothetical protein
MKKGLRLGLLGAVVLAVALGVASRPAVVHGYAVVDQGGEWPSNWPGPLEEFRARAESSYSGMPTGTPINEAIYEFSFKNREEFARAWPALLKIKSKGGTLCLMKCSPASPDMTGAAARTDGPKVMIFAPPGGPWQKADGLSSPAWMEDMESPDGVVPMCVGQRFLTGNSDEPWIAIDLGKGKRDDLDEYHLERARVDLTLYVDGDIIDLNSIRIPSDTPIVDRRFDDGQDVSQSYPAVQSAAKSVEWRTTAWDT